jgi:hypothetical protein
MFITGKLIKIIPDQNECHEFVTNANILLVS